MAAERFGQTGAYPNDDKRRVLEATDIVRLVGEHVALRKAGREFKCLCPFHDDHNPSMGVVPHKQIYHCFVCGAGGDALSFVMNYHKMGFREALQHLADRAGIALSPPPRRSGPSSVEFDEGPAVSRETLLSANQTAQTFFRAIYQHAEHGAAARAVLEKRGVSAAMIEQFGLGASPDRWDGLAVTIAGRNLPLETFFAAGLIKRREQGDGCYDALRNRLTFPIHDSLGRVVGFGGRRLNDADEPKYLNSPETLLFNKSATLYALPFASAAIREKKIAIVTEGYMDAIACHQAGVINVVATLGTALTTQGARVLRRLAETIVLLFDSDDAGRRAADRAVAVLFAEPIDVRIATIDSIREPGTPEAKDPDELLKQPGGAARFNLMIERAVDALDYRFMRLRERTAGMGLAARSRVIEEEVATLAELGLADISPIRRQLIIQRVAALAGVDEGTIRKAIPAKRVFRPTEQGVASEASGQNPAPSPPARATSAEQTLLACALMEPRMVASLSVVERAWLEGPFSPEPLNAVARLIRELAAGEATWSFADLLAGLEDEEAKRAAASLVTHIERATESKPERLDATWKGCLEDLNRRRLMQSAPAGTDGARMDQLRSAAKMGGALRTLPRPTT